MQPKVIFEFRPISEVAKASEKVIVEEYSDNWLCIRFAEGRSGVGRHVDVKVVDGKFEVVRS